VVAAIGAALEVWPVLALTGDMASVPSSNAKKPVKYFVVCLLGVNSVVHSFHFFDKN